MKIPALIVSLMVALCFLGCSKSSSSSKLVVKRLVPTSAAEIASSPEYKLEFTTKSGLQCYVRPLTPEIAHSITAESPDYSFLNGDDKTSFYFLVTIREGKIIDGSAKEYTAPEAFEVMGFVMKKAMAEDKEFQKALQNAATGKQ